MPGPYVLESGVTISREIELQIRYKRGLTHEHTQWTCDYETWFDEPLVYGVQGLTGTATIFKPGWANSALLEVTLGWDLDTLDADPLDEPTCPRDYRATGGQPRYITLNKTCSATYYKPAGNESWDPDPEVASTGTGNVLHIEQATGQIPTWLPDVWNVVTVTASGTFDVMGELDHQIGVTGDWRDFLADHDPQGDPSMAHEVFLKPVSAVTLSVTWCGQTHSVTLDGDDFANQEAFESFFRYGFGQLQAVCNASNANSDSGSPSGVMTFPTVDVAQGTFSGSGIGGGVAAGDSYGQESKPDTKVYFDPAGGGFRFAFNGNDADAPYPMMVECVKGPFAVTYTAEGADFNGAVRTGTVQTRESHDGSTWTEVALNASAVYASKGQYSLGVWDWETPDPVYRKDVRDFYGANTGYSSERPNYSIHSTMHTDKDWITHRRGGLQNLETLGEPAFPAPEGSDYWNWFDDSRCDVRSPYAALQWAAAIEFEIAESVTLVNLGTSATWTVESGAATIDYDGGVMNVTVTSGPCRISRAISGDLTGARTVEWNHTSDDTDPIEVSIDGNAWDVTPDDLLVDVVAVKGRSGSDTTQIDVANSGWAGGLHAVTALAIDNLRAGKTYHFGLVKGKRVAEAAGGFTQVEVSNDAFIGAERGAHDANDPYTSGKCLALIVDGIYAVYGDQDTMDVGWLSPDVTTQKGLVSMGFNEAATGWKRRGEVNSYHLRPGVYSSYQTVIVPAYMRSAEVWLPCCLTINPTFVTRKLLRGGIRLLVVSSTGRLPGRQAVTVEQRSTPTGDVVSTFGAVTDALGCLVLSRLQQGIDANQNYYTVISGSVSEQLEVRNRNHSQLCLADEYVIHGLLHDGTTGELHYEADGHLEYI